MNSGLSTSSSTAVGFHNGLAAKWDEAYLSPQFSCRLAAIRELLPSASGNWLDAGCGTGTIARWLSSTYNCDVEGIDAPVALVLEAKRLGTKAQVGSVEQLPYLTSSLDGILCSSVLEYLEDPRKALREFYRVLKPDGVLLVSVPRFHLRTRTLVWLLHYLTLRRCYSFLRYSRHWYTPAAFGV